MLGGVVMALEALAEPRRREILDLLRTGERSVGQVAESLHVAQPSASKHLKVLRDAGLVTVRQDAQRRWYRLRVEPLLELDAWLEPYRRLWADRLDALEAHLDALPDDDGAGERAPRAAPDGAPSGTTARVAAGGASTRPTEPRGRRPRPSAGDAPARRPTR
jgi:DNA-binding transcriptional ArsR family regulator